ncbi:MAG: transposase, partial [Alphaproteobacteria bacterium]|nr:transposase [Alphaproteobacteria bacterium]
MRLVIDDLVDRIGELYAVERSINGLPPEQRPAQRQELLLHVAEALKAWAEVTLPRLSGQSDLARRFPLH